ncbi:hypothetical protein ACIBSW_19840 [Actinoplanes sp. NPDC049668]|uniref:hypothetical protein n=1 Tax=unclassified Actinoplanes TaxID=2626549 RepID=UPI0033A2377A
MFLVSAAQLAQTPSVALRKAPRAVSLVVAAELVALGGIVSGCGAVTHGGQLAAGEELKLPHELIIPIRPALVLSDPFSIMPTYVGTERQKNCRCDETRTTIELGRDAPE